MENVLDILGGVKDYAHRGCFDKTLPENSLTAIRIAADKGLGLEIDVHLTKDNKRRVSRPHVKAYVRRKRHCRRNDGKSADRA